MSRVCPSCGGIIGRDCFNTQECQWITDQMQRQNNEDYEANRHHIEEPPIPEDLSAPASPVEKTEDKGEIPEDITSFILSISKGAGGDCYIIAACEKLYHKLTESKPSPVIDNEPLEMGLQFQNHGDSMTIQCPDEDGQFTMMVKSKGARHWQVYCFDDMDARDIASFLSRHLANAEPSASHPAPAPTVGERTDKPLEGEMLGVLNKTSDRLFQRTAPTELAIPEEVRTSLAQRFTKEYFLKVTVNSDLLPENQGNVRANISTGIYSIFSGWKNTAVDVKEINNPETK